MNNKRLNLISAIDDNDIEFLGYSQEDIEKIKTFGTIITNGVSLFQGDLSSQLFKTIANINPFLYDHNNQLDSFTTMTGSPLLLFHNKLERPSDLILLENTIKILNSSIKQNIIDVLSQQKEDVREIVLEENKHFPNFHYNSAIAKRDLTIGDTTQVKDSEGKITRKTFDPEVLSKFFNENDIFQQAVLKTLNKQKKIVSEAKKLEDKIIDKHKLNF